MKFKKHAPDFTITTFIDDEGEWIQFEGTTIETYKLDELQKDFKEFCKDYVGSTFDYLDDDGKLLCANEYIRGLGNLFYNEDMESFEFAANVFLALIK